MNDTAIIVAFSAAFAAGFLVGRVFPVKRNVALGDEGRVRAGGIEFIHFDDAWPRAARLRFIGVLLLLLGVILLTLLPLLLLPSTAHAAEPMTARDWSLEAAFGGALLVDYGQTRDLKNHSELRETNPLLGSHPTDVRIRNYMLGAAIGHAAVTYLLPPEYRPYWQAGTLIIEVGVIQHNYSLGLGMRF